MDGRTLLKVVIVTCLIASSTGRELKVKDQSTIYNHTLAAILVEYAATVYHSDLTELFTWTCPRCDDLTKGFQIIELIVDVKRCLQAFVGVAPVLNAVVIAFRGTQGTSIQNWIEDLYWKQLDIDYPGTEDAMVHHGFYSAYHNTTLRPGVLSAVKTAKELYGDIPIMVTGHSMGGAMAAFCGLDLTVWLHNTGLGILAYTIEKVCDKSGEDPSCSRSVAGNSIKDHLRYYGVRLGGEEDPGFCRIVMDRGLAAHGTVDVDGDVILSRDVPASVLRMNVESNEQGRSV